jgi:RNA polymerase sigma factor (sigma-70 family)
VSTGADSDLLSRVRQGDEHAFDRVYQLYHARLFGYLLRMARRRDLAEDLLQETWVRFAAHAWDLAEDTDLGAWLFTVARNAFLSEVRKAMTSADRTRHLSLLGLGASGPCPFELAAASETQRRLEAALVSSPIRYRELLVLVAVEQLEPSQAARVLGERPETIRKRLQRARALLAERLGEQGELQPAAITEEQHES